jgi:hypothetical protein
VQFWRKKGPKVLERERDFRPRTFGLISLSCGFATNSTIPENATDAGYVPALHEFSPVGRADRGADRRSLGMLRYSHQTQKLRSAAPLLCLIASFETSFAIRLGSVLGFAGVV